MPKIEKSIRREQAKWRRRYGMKVGGYGTKLVMQALRHRVEDEALLKSSGSSKGAPRTTVPSKGQRKPVAREG